MMRDTTSSYRHELKAWELSKEMLVPDYRTIDADDAVELSRVMMVEVFDELKPVSVSEANKEQAAHFIGQFFLDSLVQEETERLAQNIAEAITDPDKLRIVMVQIPDYINAAGENA